MKQSPVHWFGGLTRYVEVLWRTANELRVSVLRIDRGGSDLTLDYARANSSMPRPLEHAKAARVRSSRLEQGAEFARVLEHRSPLGSSMLVCNTNASQFFAEKKIRCAGPPFRPVSLMRKRNT